MPKILTPAQIETFWRDGCVFPIRVMSTDDALAIRTQLEAFERQAGGPLKGDLRHKSHLLFPWLDEVVHNARIVDAIEDLYGPDLLCWTTNFFIKEANNPAFVSWHQDSTYWGLDKPDVVTAWVALTPSNTSNGAMGFIPGTHTARPDPAPRHLRQEQPADARPGGRRRRRRDEGGDDRARAGRDLAAPRPPRPRLAGESLERSPHRLRDPLHPDERRAGGRPRQRLARSRHRPLPSLRSRAAPERERWTRRSSALHKEIAERNAQILYRGTDVKSYNDPAALPERAT